MFIVLIPSRRRAIIGTNAEILLTRPLGTNFGEISVDIHAFLFKKMNLKNVVCEMLAVLSQPLCVKVYPTMASHHAVCEDLSIPGMLLGVAENTPTSTFSRSHSPKATKNGWS